MKKILLFMSLFFIGLNSTYAEQVVKDPYTADFVYQNTIDDGLFISANGTSISGVDKLGVSKFSVAPSVNNTDYIIFKDDRNDNDSGLYYFHFGTQSWNYSGYSGVGYINTTNGTNDFVGNKIHPLKGGGSAGFNTYSRYCRTGGKFLVHEGKLIIQMYSAYNNNSQCNPSTGGVYYYDLNDQLDHRALAYTGSADLTKMVDFTAVSGRMVDIVGDSNALYTKTSDPQIIKHLYCNDFGVCLENDFVDLSGSISGDIVNIDHKYYNESYGALGYTNITTLSGGVYTPYTAILDVQPDGTWTQYATPFLEGIYYLKTFSDTQNFIQYKVNVSELNTAGVVFDNGKTPLILFEKNQNDDDSDFFYVRSNQLHNFGSTYGGNLIGNTIGSGDDGGGDSGTGTTGGGNNVPPLEDWSYFVNGYTFFENGFTLNNFVPDPFGGKLQFEIIQPNGTGSTIIFTDEIGPNSTDGNGYGLDTQVKITYPYHPVAGVYQVRVIYKYGGYTVYPFGEDYNTYTISLPEEASEFNADELFTSACDADSTNGGFIPGVSKFFSCAVETIRVGIENIFSVYESIKKLFTELGNIGNTEEVKMLHEAFNFDFDFQLIPKAHATQTYSYTGSQDPLKIISQGSFDDIPLLNNIYNFLKYGALFLLFIGMMYLIFKPQENG